jgi:pimeloyl-ACP methyl ester carboxylesterase
MQPPLIILHGALGDARQLEPLTTPLSGVGEIHIFGFPGHGEQPMPASAFSIPLFAESLLKFIQEKEWTQVNIFGYSMGGYVALYLAKQHPNLVHRIITLATKFHWDEPTAAGEVKMLDPDTMRAKVPAFAAVLEQRHKAGGWREVLKRTAEMMLAMGRDNPLKIADYAEIKQEVLLLLGDRDKMVGLDETLAVRNALPVAQLGILPGVPHPVEQVDTEVLSCIIRRFLNRP